MLFLQSVLSTGCYTLTPVVSTDLPVGAQVSLRVTDAGRVALGGSMGPEIGEVDGRLVQHNDSAYLLAVSGVRFLRGGEQRWNGERISVRNEFVSGVSEQRLSKVRSGALAGVTIAAVVYALSRGLGGFGTSEDGKAPGDTVQTTRIPHISR